MFTKKPDAEVNKPILSPAPQSMQPPVRPMGGSLGVAPKTIPSTIGPDLTIMGNLVSKGEIQVDGEVQGDINCGHLVVGESAKITGGIVAEDVIVRGRVMGSIRGLKVTLQSSSHVEGDVYHQSLAIEQGAMFEGRSRRADDPLGSAPKPESPKTNGALPSS